MTPDDFYMTFLNNLAYKRIMICFARLLQLLNKLLYQVLRLFSAKHIRENNLWFHMFISEVNSSEANAIFLFSFQILDKADYTVISGNPYIKKSGNKWNSAEILVRSLYLRYLSYFFNSIFRMEKDIIFLQYLI